MGKNFIWTGQTIIYYEGVGSIKIIMKYLNSYFEKYKKKHEKQIEDGNQYGNLERFGWRV